jgi:hypothetical protein
MRTALPLCDGSGQALEPGLHLTAKASELGQDLALERSAPNGASGQLQQLVDVGLPNALLIRGFVAR